MIEPAIGELACGCEGKGRMEEPEAIFERIAGFFLNSKKLNGKRTLVTAGPTYEAIDPVRFIGNHSSGLMGICIADELANCGAEVVLVCGPSVIKSKNSSVKRVDVVSAKEMFEACKQHFESADITVCSAAVADYAPKHIASQKIKKKDQELILELAKTPDILAYLGEHKKTKQVLVGFALETENEFQNAETKLKSKHLDMLILNSLNDEGAGFGYTTNKISILSPNQPPKNFDLKSKADAAKDIVNEIIKKHI
jgi:phosphopantothenoylcysteine decarboxylase/phosphopantothenate--cysteine ligase